ncbi:MAG: flagellin [Veillonellaceae bacterium]|jgi:flagellin|uniref:flagellin n=1 Tax=Selenomonas sp. TaxID=2053611 RepID=UPI0025F47D2F|nr:flagellin [Selenomonas sp.]MCI6232378.1 flagellin [Selenomonas sp.]MCI7541107.1 flagellin [Veillonellaceae bacterium]MDD6126813.1 flagellin [Veillonellaceae bacterium]MDD6697489.1 flagellin [Veillonellaceae bacterium]
MYVNNFVMSTSILNTLNYHQTQASKHLLNISTGLKIRSVADDPSGWAIGQRMDVRIRSLDAANGNAQRMKSLLKVADGGISSTVDILRKLKEKAIEAANDTATDSDRQTIQKLFDQYVDQIDDNAYVDYNGKNLLDGSRQGAAQATQQAYTNRALSTDTTATTKLTDLARRNGDSLGITDSDTINISYVKEGKTYSASFSAKDATVEDIFTKMNAIDGDVFDVAGLSTTSVIGTDAYGEEKQTVDGENALTIKAKTAGKDGAIAGFTIGITDSKGQEKKSVNNVFNEFTETIEPRNVVSDSSLYAQTSADANRGMKISLGDMRAEALGLRGRDGTVLSVTTKEGANAAMNVLDNALSRALDQQTTVGAMSSRLDYTISNLTVQSENLTDAKSTILDADMAKEMLAYTKENVLMQAAMAMLAQNNQNAAWFLSLLG